MASRAPVLPLLYQIRLVIWYIRSVGQKTNKTPEVPVSGQWQDRARAAQQGDCCDLAAARDQESCHPSLHKYRTTVVAKSTA